MISFLGSSEDVGIYGIAFKIAQEAGMVRSVISTAIFPIIVKGFHKGSIKTSRLLRYSGMFFFGILSLAIIGSYFAEDFVSLFLGGEYLESGSILSVLIFYIAVNFATLPFTNAMLATNNEKISLLFNIVRAVLNVILNYILFFWYGLIGIAYSTLIVSAVAGTMILFVSIKILKKQGHLM